jgi:hypothetical protein
MVRFSEATRNDKAVKESFGQIAQPERKNSPTFFRINITSAQIGAVLERVAMEQQNQSTPPPEVWTWVGRRQAFGLIANKCSAADAECLKQLRESKHYKGITSNWEDFCPRYLCISRAQADKVIHRLEEFGTAYFALSQIVRIPEDAYRAIAGSISDHAIEFNGEKIPICAENGRLIAEVVKYLRDEATVATRCLDGLAESIVPYARRKTLAAIRKRLDAAFAELEAISGEPGDQAGVTTLIDYSYERLARFKPAKAQEC